MAKYSYDESGSMAGYFLITFLALVLVPTTLSAIKPLPQNVADSCQCAPCKENRRRLSKLQKGSLLNPKFTKKALFLLLGWSLLAFASYRVMGTTTEGIVYDPFEILGIKTGTPEKEIKSHFKKLSRMYHPDKVKATANQTIEMIQQKFVDITKAYKSLTDETIRKNWELYGNPDGRQEMSMGIALPQWIIESKNNIWVLGVYGILFGGALPALVGRWWFGSREKTKDGVHARSAAMFFKSLREESNMDQIIGTLSKSFTWEYSTRSSSSDAEELQRLEQEISTLGGKAWKTVEPVIRGSNDLCKRAFILVYAHLLRLQVKRSSLVNEQVQILQQTPVLLNSLLNMTLARNWLFPALDIMRLHAYLVQALPPSPSFLVPKEGAKTKLTNPRAAWFAQLPGISLSDDAIHGVSNYDELVKALDDSNDKRASDAKKALSKWGHVDIVDVAFKVIGERVVSPSSIVYLVVKLRLKSPISQPSNDNKNSAKELDADQVKRRVKLNDELEEEFLKSRNDAEELNHSANVVSGVHAPQWPGERKPSWWIILADDKSNRVVVPPIKISDIPYAQLPDSDSHEVLLQHDYRAYKIQFQSPPNIGMFTWKVYIVSDTFVGEEVTRDITMKIEEAPVSATDDVEDEISEPDEDSLAGQMAAMRGGAVKKRDDDDDDSSEEDSDKGNSSSDSDSD